MITLSTLAATLLVTIGAAIPSGSPPDDGAPFYAIATKEGQLVIFNGETFSYTVQFFGKEIAPTQKGPLAFIVDGKIIQIASTPTTSVFESGVPSGLAADSLLTAHMRYEAGYLEGLVKEKLPVTSKRVAPANGIPALLWWFANPAKFSGNGILAHYHMTIYSLDHYIVLASIATQAAPGDAIEEELVRVAGTIKTSRTPFDVQAISDSIRKASR